MENTPGFENYRTEIINAETVEICDNLAPRSDSPASIIMDGAKSLLFFNRFKQ
jgi:hypothetical protein